MIVVTAPTGQIGRGLLARLLDGAEEPVRVIARDPAALDPAVRERAEVVEGSHADPATVATAFEGADTVFWLVPPDPRADDVTGHYLDFTRPACEAIGRHGVRRVVGVSSLGREFGENAGNLSSAFAMDALIETTGVAYRSLRMPYFMENLLMQAEAIRHGAFHLPNAADRTLRLVATADVAATAADLLRVPAWSGQSSVPVLSPDSLTPREMATTLSEVLGTPVAFHRTPIAGFRATMLQYGMSEGWARGLVDMALAQDAGIYEPEALAAEPSPTGFRQWCEDVLRPAVRG
ncbi:NAD(P)H-binding protein [Streptomyces sp. NBC_01218]|uniref:NAD(P)H-binding protein n=1 Tax=Streptomyces sp. NBC_01218 TaxID=2903780 RepID=UPI002E14B439|nr:NAD(P)H-binding protein [Streptomyces sp. NBC_01218]